MRIPLSWLNEYIPLTLPPNKIAEMLTMAGLEVDSFETVGDNLKDIVVGLILDVRKHPNADKLNVASVTDGKEVYQVVCGAPNCRPGIKVALAQVGIVLKTGDQTLEIKKAKIRGIESQGMLCSEKELGLSDEHEGILELPEKFSLGASLAKDYSNTYFNISLTPNLSHCSSIFGVARELAALTEQNLHPVEISLNEGKTAAKKSLKISVLDKKECPRYVCRVIKNVKVGPSPDWLKERLKQCAVPSINNIVDVTNYVLLEMGHPLHAFDLDKLEGKEIIVRKARAGEQIKTLDDKERILDEQMLVICDHSKPVAIAGIMGGFESKIEGTSCHVVLESAYFDPISIRRTSKKLMLQTDASKRFERGTDPNHLLLAVDRAAMLIQEVAGGEIEAGVLEFQVKEFPETIIACRLDRINQLIGTTLSRGEVESIFKRLQFFYQWDGQGQFKVHVPTYRNDIKGEIDVIEEVARLYGYHLIPRQRRGYQACKLPSVPMYSFAKTVRSRLMSEGLQEFLTCDLIGPSILQVVQQHSMPKEAFIKVLNPTSVEQSILRTSLLPGLLQVLKYNIDHQNHHVAGFEIGRIHYREQPFDKEQYQEQPVVGLILTGKSSPHHWERQLFNFDFFDLKGIIENLLKELGIVHVVFKNLGLKTFHSGRQASIFVDSLEIGSIGEIHPSIQRRLDVQQRILFGEFNLQDLFQISKQVEKVKPLAIYPSSERDWTLTVKETLAFAMIADLVQAQNSSILEEVSLKDIYRSEKLPFGYQNMTLHFVYRDLSKTVEQERVDTEHKRLISSVLNNLSENIYNESKL